MSVSKTYQITVTFSSPQGIADDDTSMLEFIAKVKRRIKDSVYSVVDTGSLKADVSDISEV